MDPIDNWHSDHAANLKLFLGTPTGRVMLEILKSMAPLYAQTPETTDVVRQACRREGYETCLNNMTLVTQSDFLVPPKEATDAYPPLDDDTKWNDSNQPKE